MITVDELFDENREGYAWGAAFDVATPRADDERFARSDIVRVVAAGMGWGDYAETTCIAIFELANGRFGYLNASCDTTGWDCQASGEMGIEDTEQAARARLASDELATLDAGKLVAP